MSYLFDADNELLYATLGTALNVGSTAVTIACFFKQATFVTEAHILAVSNSNSSNTGMARLYATGTTNVWWAQHNDATYNRRAEITDDITADGWVPMIGVFSSASARQIYVDGVAGTDLGSTHDPYDLTYVRIGVSPLGGDHLRGRVARVAIWNTALDASQRLAYESGTHATNIAYANLRAYWSLESDLTKTSGNDSVGSLTASGATFDSDNPVFSRPRMALLGVG